MSFSSRVPYAEDASLVHGAEASQGVTERKDHGLAARAIDVLDDIPLTPSQALGVKSIKLLMCILAACMLRLHGGYSTKSLALCSGFGHNDVTTGELSRRV